MKRALLAAVVVAACRSEDAKPAAPPPPPLAPVTIDAAPTVDAAPMPPTAEEIALRDQAARIHAEMQRENAGDEARRTKWTAAQNAKDIADAELTAERNRQDAAAKLLAGRVHLKRLSDAMQESGSDDRFEVGDIDTEVRYVGPCTQKTIDDLAARMRSSFASYGFRRIRCAGYTASLE